MLKSELRKKYLEKRKTLSMDEVLSLSDKIFQNFMTHFAPKKGDSIHIFLSIDKFKEVSTTNFIQQALTCGFRLFVPKMIDGKLISLSLTSETILETNSWGIQEPVGEEDSGEKDFNYVITPLLYCDKSGNRVGYGKGFYDGLFHSLPKSTKKIGVGFFSPNEEVSDATSYDVKLNYLINPDEIVSFGTGEEGIGF